MSYINPEEITGQVSDLYIKRYGESDIFHVVIVKNDETTEVFQNRDAFWVGKFDSADMQQRFEIGKTVTVVVRGMRVPFLSRFRNVIEIVR